LQQHLSEAVYILCRHKQKQWRLHDLDQRSLDNARVIWGRFMEKNRREVEERAEQLKSLGNLAALVAGFAVVAFLEFGGDFDKSKTLTLAFGTTAALVVRSGDLQRHNGYVPELLHHLNNRVLISLDLMVI
jgi:hypothetical protein